MVQEMAVQSVHLCRSKPYPVCPRRVTWIKTKRESVKSGCSGAIKPDRHGMCCKANKCSDAGPGDLGVLTIHETSPWFSLGDVGPTRPGECRLNYKKVGLRKNVKCFDLRNFHTKLLILVEQLLKLSRHPKPCGALA